MKHISCLPLSFIDPGQALACELIPSALELTFIAEKTTSAAFIDTSSVSTPLADSAVSLLQFHHSG